jgi:hypothetical protein
MGKVALVASRTLAVYGFAGWAYIALVALVHPDTLHMQLTHFAKFPHEDTFGEICFVISVAGFFFYNLLRPSNLPSARRDSSGSALSEPINLRPEKPDWFSGAVPGTRRAELAEDILSRRRTRPVG